MSTTVTYKGNTLATVNNDTKTLNTQGQYLDADIVLTDVSGGFGAVYQDENGYVVLDNGSPNTEVLNINQNGIYNVAGYGQANVNVTGGGAAFSIVDTVDEAGGTIRSITTVGAREDLTIPKDVDFIDYDGRLLYSYTATEFLALTALPENPVNPGLVAQGWNWTLADAKEYVGQWGALVIGQNYTTHDGKTRIYISVPKIFTDRSRQVRFTPHALSTVSYTIDWGDGTTNNVKKTTTTAAMANSPWHTYSTPGDYVVTINVTDGELIFGYQGVNISVFGDSFYDYYMLGLITKIEIGNSITKFGRQPFYRFRNMKSVSIPTTCTGMDTSTDCMMFGECASLRGIVFPSGMVGRDAKMFDGSAYNLSYVSVPKTMTRFNMAQNIRNLRKLTLPPQAPVSNTTLQVKLYNTGSITHLVIPGTYTTIQDNTLNYSYVKKLVVPASVTTLSGNATFSHNVYLEELHMLPTTPPTLGHVNCITGNTSMTIYVPYSADHSILEAYQTATNWSTYASVMQEEPQS